MEIKSTMPWNEFLSFIGVNEVAVLKGKGRAYTYTTVGTVFFATSVDDTKPMYVGVGGDTLVNAKGESLAGTLWCFNSKAQLYKTIGKQ